MADWYTRRNGDFEEAEVWSFSKHSEPISSPALNTNRKPSVSSRGTTAPRAIPADGDGKMKSMTQRSSAPMNIPDWSKIYGANNGGYYDDYYRNNNNDDNNREGEEEEDDEDVVPPHEWLAKKLARSSKVSSFSVCEGIGRTLKGRDLSKVRNAILTKTGFLEG